MPEIVGAVPFTEANDFFRQKVNLPTQAWTDLKEGMHARAFVIAGATKDHLLTDFRTALQKALDDGTTLADFRKDFDRIVARHGWSYNGSRGWRSRVIYDTNMRTARAAGRWQQIERLSEQRQVYLRYVAVMDSRTRPEHKTWHGTVLPREAAFWDTHYPPNGWNCRCTVQVLTDRQLRRYGYSVSAPPDVVMEARQVRLPDGTTDTWSTPEGVDTGWGYNVGRAAWGRQVDERTMQAWRQSLTKWEPLSTGDWRTVGRPERLPADTPRVTINRSVGQQDGAEILTKVLGGPQRTFRAPDGSALSVTAETLANHVPVDRLPYLRFLPDVIEAPAEIWISFERHAASGKIALRKRFVKVVQLEQDRFIVLAAQAVGGRFEAWTVVPTSKARYLQGQRKGVLVWARDLGT